MLKSQIFKLLEDIKELKIDEMPVIAGSQSLHAFTDHLPSIAKRSVECDFLFASGNTEYRDKVNKELGVLTEYQDKQGFYADAVGIATIVLPDGWESRLKPLEDGSGETVALCIDIHDLAASKLIAGREKDLIFLENALASELIVIDLLFERIRLVRSKVENDTISDRLTRLYDVLKQNHFHRDICYQIKKFLNSANIS